MLECRLNCGALGFFSPATSCSLPKGYKEAAVYPEMIEALHRSLVRTFMHCCNDVAHLYSSPNKLVSNSVHNEYRICDPSIMIQEAQPDVETVSSTYATCVPAAT